MPKTPNIFHDVSRNETFLTRILFNFLYYEPFREKFFEPVLGKDKAQNIRAGDIKIEHQLKLPGGECIPDIAVMNQEIEILIEIKANPYIVLTENQPNTYYKCLMQKSKEGKERHLVLICPQHFYYRDNWNAAIDMLQRRYGKENVKVNTLYWQQIADLIVQEHFADSCHKAFHDCCHEIRRCDLETITFDKVELDEIGNVNWMKLLEKLYKLVDNLCAVMETKAGGYLYQNYWYGFCFKNRKGNLTEVFFAVHHPLWRQFGNPLFLGITTEAAPKQIQKLRDAAFKVFNQQANSYKTEWEGYKSEKGWAVPIAIDASMADPTKVLKERLESCYQEMFKK